MANLRNHPSALTDVAGPPGMLVGYSIRESGTVAAAATVVLRHGAADTAPIVAAVALAADGAETAALPAIPCPDGIFVERAAGETTVTLYTN